MPRLNNQLVVKMETIISLYESLELKSSGIGIDVKVPKCNDLKEYISNLKEIEFIFSQCPYLKNENEQIKFNSVDVGSQWLTFIIELSATVSATAFGVSYVLKNFAILVDKAFVLKSHFLTVREQQEKLKLYEKKNELLESEIETFEKLKKMHLDNALSDIKTELGEIEDPEENTKLEKSVEKLEKLMEKGFEFAASIDASDEIKAVFPPLEENEKSLEDFLKYIEKKDN